MMLKSKLDIVRNEKEKAKKEWKRLDEQLTEKKDELKIISNDNNPYMKRIKLLENKLDKAMIKYNEAMSIRRTYEQILEKLKEERTGYDHQITELQKNLKTKENDCKEFKQLVLDAKQAKNLSQLLVENTKLSVKLINFQQKAFERHFDQLVAAHEQSNRPEIRHEKKEKKPQKLDSIVKSHSDESSSQGNDYSTADLERKLKAYEEAEKSIINIIGTSDINEICQKYSNLKETKEKLESEAQNLEVLFETLRNRKNYLIEELNKLKYYREDGINSSQIQEYDKQTRLAIRECDQSKRRLKRTEKMLVDIHAGFMSLISVLKNKIVMITLILV